MPHRILVVEDHNDCREALVLLLQLAGYDVDHAPTGPDGLRQAMASRPDVAILDLDLPGVDGYAIAETLRGLPNPPLLIATSGSSQQRDRDRVVAAGFDGFLLKPWDVPDLEAIMNGAPRKERA